MVTARNKLLMGYLNAQNKVDRVHGTEQRHPLLRSFCLRWEKIQMDSIVGLKTAGSKLKAGKSSWCFTRLSLSGIEEFTCCLRLHWQAALQPQDTTLGLMYLSFTVKYFPNSKILLLLRAKLWWSRRSQQLECLSEYVAALSVFCFHRKFH